MSMESFKNFMEQYRAGGGDLNEAMSWLSTMASNGKTPLGLNQWRSSDKPVMDDFNKDNEIIDDNLSRLWTKKTEEEAGVWSPELGIDDGTPGKYEYADGRKYGFYHRVGSLVSISGELVLSKIITPSQGRLTITGLPFAPKMSRIPVCFANVTGFSSEMQGKQLQGYLRGGEQRVMLITSDGRGVSFFEQRHLTDASWFMFSATFSI